MSDLAHATEQIGKWTRRRNELIRLRRAAGGSLRDIAADAGLTHSGVAKILKETADGCERSGAVEG